jgi:hypothetical protein
MMMLSHAKRSALVSPPAVLSAHTPTLKFSSPQPTAQAKLQGGFLTHIVVPLFQALARLFPETDQVCTARFRMKQLRISRSRKHFDGFGFLIWHSSVPHDVAH